MASTDLLINEIFHSIQGESTWAGLPCTFIRLTGCHLRCTYCDTEYSFHEGSWMSLDEVVTAATTYGCRTVELTGGEPLLQPAARLLLARLADSFETVLLETSGAVSIADIDPRVIRVMDLKTPSSGESHRNLWSNLSLLTPRDELKFVIGTREDYDWSVGVLREHGLLGRCPVLFSPVTGCDDSSGLSLYKGHLDPADLAAWMLADRLDVRLGLQLHKIIWSPTARGV